MEQFVCSVDRALSIVDSEWDYDAFPEISDGERTIKHEDTDEVDVSRLKPRRSEDKYKCWFCSYRTGETITFRDHVATKHANQYHCLKCMGRRLALFNSRNECYAHIASAHGIKGPHAQALTQSVAKRLLLETIQQFRANSKLRSFPGTDATNDTPRANQPVLVCEICKTYQTGAAASYVAHRMAHRNLRRYQCAFCGLRANFRSNVRKHIKSCHRGEMTKSRKVIVLSEQEARKTILQYLDSQKERKGFNPGKPPDLAILPNLQCKFCRFRTPFSQVLNLHYLKTHNKTYTKVRNNSSNKQKQRLKLLGKRCSICKKHRAACKSRARLHWALRHLRRPARIACGSCCKVFKDANSLLNHWQNMHAKLTNKQQTCAILIYRHVSV